MFLRPEDLRIMTKREVGFELFERCLRWEEFALSLEGSHTEGEHTSLVEH